MAEIGSTFLTILPSMKDFDRTVNTKVSSTGHAAGKNFGDVFARASLGPIRAIGATALGFFAVDKIKDFFSATIDEAEQARKGSAQTAAVIKSTGGAANISARGVDKLASSLSAKIGVDDDTIRSNENLLLTFTNVRNEVGRGNNIFNRATRTVANMSAALGQDGKSSAIQLGKALNDPIKGITALQRVGVSFTAQQKAQITAMVKSGNTLGAQKMILHELNKEFGGSAAAQATAGDKLRAAYKNLQEQIGTALLPVIDRFASYTTTKVIPAVSRFISQMHSGTGAGGQFAAGVKQTVAVIATVASTLLKYKTVIASVVVAYATWRAAQIAFTAAQVAFNAIQTASSVALALYSGTLKVVALGTKLYAGAQAVLNAVMTANPIGLVIAGIAALAIGLVFAYKHSQTFRTVVQNTFTALKTVVGPAVAFIKTVVQLGFKAVSIYVRTYITVVRTVVTAGWAVIKAVTSAAWATFKALVLNPIRTTVAGVRTGIEAVIKVVIGIKTKIKGALGSGLKVLAKFGGDIVQGLVNGISGAAHKVLAAVHALVDKIPAVIRHKMGIASPSKVTTDLGVNIGEGLANGMASRNAAVGGAAEKLAETAKKKLKAKLAKIKDEISTLSGSIASSFTSDLFSSTGSGPLTGSGFISNLTSTQGNLSGLLAAFKTLKGFGLPASFLSQLFSQGGAPLILELASNKGEATQASSLFGSVTSLSNQLGNSVATNQFGGAKGTNSRLDETNRLLRENNKLLGRVERAAGNSGTRAAANARRRAQRGHVRAA